MTASRASRSARRRPARFQPQVEALEELQLLSTYVVTTSADNGDNNNPIVGSFRWAIQEANAHPNSQNPVGVRDRIEFDIPQAMSKSILVQSALPFISEGVVIDGYSQAPGSVTPPIQLVGSQAGIANGLYVFGGNTTISGFIINRFSGSGIRLESGGDNVVQGCWIGTDLAGTSDQGNGFAGITINTSGGNLIGGTTAAERNVISGNDQWGVELMGNSPSNLIRGNYIGTDWTGTFDVGNGEGGITVEVPLATLNSIGGSQAGMRNVISGNAGPGVMLNGTTGVFVYGNYIGMDATGTQDLGNDESGVEIQGGGSHFIGGSQAGLGNVISGNAERGVYVHATAEGSFIQGNKIGTAVDGVTALGNGLSGVFLQDSTENQVGGTGTGAGNVIAFNGSNGVSLGSDAKDNAIQGNSIFDNGGLGIDHGANGVTANASGDDIQNYPVLTSVETDSGVTVIEGTVTAGLGNPTRIEFFSSPTADPSGHGEGRTFLGFVNVTGTLVNSTVSFTFTPASPVPAGHFVTATATWVDGTSEFSAAVQAVDVTPPVDQPDMPIPPPPVTPAPPQVQAFARRLRRTASGRQVFQVRLRNLGGGPLKGPVLLVFDGLARRVRLVGMHGLTRQQQPAGSPFLVALPAGELAVGGELEVRAVFRTPTRRAPRFGVRVLSGVGVP